MHVVVLGAGVVGVTTAYYLSERGHTVTVIDRAGDVASCASSGNGGQLSYSFTDAMASPALLAKLPGLLTGRDSAFHVRPPIDTMLMRWGLSFLQQCTSRRQRQNTLAVLERAMRSRSLMADLQSRVPLEFAYRQAGKLVMLSGHAQMAAAEDLCAAKREYGCQVRVVSLEQALEIEPALSDMKDGYVGAVYSENDEVGDAGTFATQLAHWLSSHSDTEFMLNTTVHRIATREPGGLAVETDKETLRPEAVVVCMGAWSNRLLKPLGVRANIYPVRGYSVTLKPGEKANSVSLSDLENKMVFSRLGDQLRIAGFADFVGYKTDLDSKRAKELLDTARRIAPAIADYDTDSYDEWGGFRPMTPDSQPIVGATGVDGLYINSGHGMLGWTLACATGHELATCLSD